MTAPAPDTLERERDKLFITDAELIRLLGVPEKTARDAIRALDQNPRSGFPKKQKLWGDRRPKRAILAWLDTAYGVKLLDDAARSAAENRALRTRLPRRHPTEPIRKGNPHD